MKNSGRNADARKLDYIQENSTINWIREESIHDPRFSTRNNIRVPDLKKKGEIEVLLEHDTVKVHGELGFPNERTQKRNRDYAITKRNAVYLNEDLARMLKLDESNLATYLYFHELAKVKAYLDAQDVVSY